MHTQKSILAVHDISCVGRCSLTVALPILSAAGLCTGVLPTAVLSTHTGGFTDFTYRDLTADILPIAQHWKSLNLAFDAIYTGFLGSFEQLELVSQLFDDFRQKNNLILVDPVMADNGELYKIFTPEFAKGMAQLCSQADVIVPNRTEAAFLLDQPYQHGPQTPAQVEALLHDLADLGPGQVVLTGVHYDDATLGAATYDRRTGEIHTYFRERVPGYYHGTGDVFGSALLGALLNGFALNKATQVAVDFTVDSILHTQDKEIDIRYGVRFEQALPGYLRALGLV